MRMMPRYFGPRVLQLEAPVADPSISLLRQRRRLGDVLGTLSRDQWNVASRCACWSVQDVVNHLVDLNQVWERSIVTGRAGASSEAFRGFDPVSTPLALVEAARGAPPAETLSRFAESNEVLAGAVAGLGAVGWTLTGESPVGHVGMYEVAVHALWDSWIHERDILEPLGISAAEEPDEVAACLRYVAALSPALLAAQGSTRRGEFEVEPTDLDQPFVVEVGSSVVVRGGDAPGAVRLVGRAVDLVEGLTFRAPLDLGVAATDRWLFGGLAAAFDIRWA